MQLRFLLIIGPNRPPASIDFGPGLNVVYGGSNTGKSHILRLVDYALGAKNPPEPIPEQAGYDLVHVGLVLDDGTEVTIVRALQGGDVRILEGLVRSRPDAKQGISVSAQHAAKISLSKYLLEKLGANGARVRTDASGKTRDLSFRDLLHHALVEESKIQAPTSPILSGQYVTKTAETSVFKYMVTGVDDSALDLAKSDPKGVLKQAAQLELLDKQIRDLQREIDEASQDHEELRRLDESLESQLTESFDVQEYSELGYRELLGRRRGLREQYEFAQDRQAEIETLQARFVKLAEHYASDERRLASTIEAGTFFLLEDQSTCPICGALPKHHRPEHACEGDVSAIVAAATVEVNSLRARARELQQTLQALSDEHAELEERLKELSPALSRVQREISHEIPSVQAVRSQTQELVRQRIVVQKELAVVRRRDLLVSQRSELGVSPGYDSSTIVAQQQLDGSVLDSLCRVIEAELHEWEFPQAQRVFFELQKLDISVAGKSRAANGKGVRALLHGAFSIGLLKFCRSKKQAHPGFSILDSLFITYKDPVDDQENEIAKTPLKDRAFGAFSTLPQDLQIIILDNVEVPSWLKSNDQCTHFTGRPGVGRSGLFPSTTGE